MGTAAAIEVKNLSLSTKDGRTILSDLSFHLEPGSFLIILGENGAGKTSLLDLSMGFRAPTLGQILVKGNNPFSDPHDDRHRTAYLSEKVDLPGDWSVQEFFEFNSAFFKSYNPSIEAHLKNEYKIDPFQRIGNMSAGEIRRVQIVAALSAEPDLILIDEITAVLDILGRHRFLNQLAELNRKKQTTIVLATNIVEDLDQFASHIALINKGKLSLFETLQEFKSKNPASTFSGSVAQKLAAL